MCEFVGVCVCNQKLYDDVKNEKKWQINEMKYREDVYENRFLSSSIDSLASFPFCPPMPVPSPPAPMAS